MMHYSDITGRQWLLWSSHHLGEYTSLNWSKREIFFLLATFFLPEILAQI